MNQTRIAIALAVLAVLLASPGYGQLAGPYTIDATQPTGGGNYASFIAAATDLTTMGVSAATTFYVTAGTGPYAGFSLGQVPGSSAASPVIFQATPGPKPILTGVASGFAQTVRFGTGTSSSTPSTGPSHVTFDGFEITGAPSGAAFLAIGCDFITVRNCVAHTSGSGIGLTVSSDCAIEDCDVYGTNHVPGTGGNASYSGGIWAYSSSANNVIQRNRIHDCADNGIFVGSSGPTTECPDNIVINNFIWNCGTQTVSTYAGGIAMRRTSNCIVANNSVSMPASSSWPCIFLMGNTASVPQLPAECTNNILQHTGAGACFQTEFVGGFGAVQDHNVFDPIGGGALGAIGTSLTAPTSTYGSLPLWQAATGVDGNSQQAPAGFVSATDLHIIAGVAAWNTGGFVSAVLDDIDGDPRCTSITDVGADEIPAPGICARFTASPRVGPAPLTVTFTDTTYTSDPGGVTTWAWDFDNNGTVDSILPNPSYAYTVPGTYSVSLTASDVMHGPSTHTEIAYITVTPYVFSATTTGAADLTINPIPHLQAPGATSGYMFVSLATSLPAGTGPFLGLVPDVFTWSILPIPETPGNVLHWTYVPGLWPDVSLNLPPGSMTNFIGLSVDFVQIDLAPGLTIVHLSTVSRVSF